MALITDLSELPQKGRLLGVDHGKARIGFAITDAERKIAQPLEAMRNNKLESVIQRMQQIVNGYHIRAIVVGYPLEMNGREGPRCQSVRAFVRKIETAFDQPFLLWDERLSTEIAAEKLQETHGRLDESTGQLDAASAAVILESLLKYLPK